MTTKDTTQSGVSNKPEATETTVDKQSSDTTSLSLRESALDSIAENAKKQRAIEEGEFNQQFDDEQPSVDAKSGIDSDAPDDRGEPETEVIKVDGKDYVVTKDRIDKSGSVRALQMEIAAANRLREAGELRKQAEEALNSAKQNSSQRQNDVDDEDSGLPDKDARGKTAISAEARALADKLYSGDEDEAAEAIELIFQRTNKSATQEIKIENLSPDLIEKVEYEMDRKKGVRAYLKDYADLAKNPELNHAVNRYTAQLKLDHPDWTPSEIIKTAAKTVRQQTGNAGRSEDQERIDRKRTMDNVSSATGRFQSMQPEQAPKSPSDAVKELRAGRTASSY